MKPATAADAPALAALHAQCFAQAWNAQTIADLLAQTPVFALASEHGFIIARATGGEAEILTLAVAPSARRQGLGAALVQAAAERAHSLGAETMFLEVDETNGPARALYESLGFFKVGTRKAYYAGGGNALILKAALPLSVLGKTG